MTGYYETSSDSEGEWIKVSTKRAKRRKKVGEMASGRAADGRASVWPGRPLAASAPLPSTSTNPPVPPYGGSSGRHRAQPRTYAQVVRNVYPTESDPEEEYYDSEQQVYPTRPYERYGGRPTRGQTRLQKEPRSSDREAFPRTRWSEDQGYTTDDYQPQNRSMRRTYQQRYVSNKSYMTRPVPRPTVRWRQDDDQRDYKPQNQGQGHQTGNTYTRQEVRFRPRPRSDQNRDPTWRRPVYNRRNPPQQYNTNYKRPSTELAKQIRTIYKLLKLQHHHNSVADWETYPPTINRAITYITDLIKPAYPTADIRQIIEANAKNWGANTMGLLQEHYTEQILLQKNTLQRDLGIQEWEHAFDIAVKWTQKNLPRITKNTILQTKRIIRDTLQMDIPDPPEHAEEPQPPPPEEEPQPPPPEDTQYPKFYTSTGTQVNGDHPPRPVETPTGFSSKVGGRVPSLTPKPLPQRLPQQRSQPPLRQYSGVGKGMSGLQQKGPSQENKSTIVEIHREWDTKTPGVLTEQDEEHFLLLKGLLDEELDLTTPKSDSPFTLFKGTPTNATFDTNTQQINIHSETKLKLARWPFVPEKEYIIIADDTMYNTPAHTYSNLQIDCYPGTNFGHLQGMLSRMISHPVDTVTHLILAVGIHHKDIEPPETNIKQLDFLMNTAKQVFPKTNIFIPLIHLNPNHSEKQKQNITNINQHISTNYKDIPLLRPELVHTERNQITWTADTAHLLLEHWMMFLNSGSPRTI